MGQEDQPSTLAQAHLQRNSKGLHMRTGGAFATCFCSRSKGIQQHVMENDRCLVLRGSGVDLVTQALAHCLPQVLPLLQLSAST